MKRLIGQAGGQKTWPNWKCYFKLTYHCRLQTHSQRAKGPGVGTWYFNKVCLCVCVCVRQGCCQISLPLAWFDNLSRIQCFVRKRVMHKQSTCLGHNTRKVNCGPIFISQTTSKHFVKSWQNQQLSHWQNLFFWNFFWFSGLSAWFRKIVFFSPVTCFENFFSFYSLLMPYPGRKFPVIQLLMKSWPYFIWQHSFHPLL